VTESAPLLSIRDLRKVYPGGKLANAGISIEVGRGEVFGLLGPNGAGKTTLVSQVIGLLRPTSGEIRLGDVDLVRHPAVARRACAYLPQGRLPIDSLPIATAVELIARLRGADTRGARRRTRALLAALEIEEWADQLGSRVSGGVRRLTGFAMAIVWPAPLVILDEPTNDVDPLRRRLLWREVRRVADGGSAILLVTHNVLEAERTVDRLAVLDRGRILAQGSPAALADGAGGIEETYLRLIGRPEMLGDPGAGAIDMAGRSA